MTSKWIWKLFKTSDKNIRHTSQVICSVKVQSSGEKNLKILEYVVKIIINWEQQQCEFESQNNSLTNGTNHLIVVNLCCTL